jgi:exopolysaccharide production protein ExoZ
LGKKRGIALKHTQEIRGIQYLRGYASLAVVIAHSIGMMGEEKYFKAFHAGAGETTGLAGVYLFFVISGFIMAYIALRPATLVPTTPPSKFFWNRFARIIPFMWVCILAWIALRFLGRGHEAWTGHWPAYLRALTLWPIGDVDPPQIWTLRHELLFYLLFGLMLVRAKYRFLPLFIWIAAPFLILPAAPLLARQPQFIHEMVGFLANPVNLLFGLGLACGIIYLRYPRWFLPIIPGGSLACLGMCLAAIAIITAWIPHNPLGLIPIAGALCALILYVAIRCRSAGISHMDRFSERIGDASYATYLIHPIVIAAILTFAARIFPQANVPVLLAVCIVSAAGAGLLVHRYAEIPIVRLFRKPGVGF